MIKAIFFDMGGVLLPLHVEPCIEAYHNIAGFKDIENYINPWHQKGLFKDLEKGVVSLDDFAEECLKHCYPGTTRQTLIDCHSKFFDPPKKETVDIVHEYAAKYDVFVLSNINEMAIKILTPIYESIGLPLDSSFKKLFFSYRMHMLKPDQEIYLEAIAQSGYKPEEILFIDDSQLNVDAGNAAGIKSVLYVPGTSLRDLIESNLY